MISLARTSDERSGVSEDAIGDPVIRLREWGTDRSHVLPRTAVRDCLVGSSEACGLRLTGARISPRHAELTYDRRRWWIRDLGGTGGLQQDGVPREEFSLTPGVEIGVGGTTLIAESLRSIALREFCARLLGWGADRIAAVDHALRAIRLAAARRSALVLRGDGDLVPIALALHRHAIGVEAPFIVCDRRRANTRASVRAPANHDTGIVAVEAAAGGSLCLRSSRPPRDVRALLRRLHEWENPVQLIVCLERDSRDALLTGPMPIELPPLRFRAAELPRIVDEYAKDAIAALDAAKACFTEEDRAWVMASASTSLSEIEKATMRIVAVKLSTTMHQAAERLGMAPVSLSRWFDRRLRFRLSFDSACRA
jgi:hypothetical protein